MAEKRLSTAELDRQIKEATERGRVAAETEPRAERAYYDAKSGRIVLELRDGCLFAFPPRIVEGLHSATPEQLSAVEIEGDGYNLRWPLLDESFSVPGLLAGRFGTRRWMAEIGRQGGKVTSEAKAQAARENGRKGGRPRKRPQSEAPTK
jgi:hypothetical protein